MLHNTLFTYIWFPLYIETSVDAAVDRLTVAITHAIETAVPTGCIKRCKFPILLSSDLNFISGKIITFTSVLRNICLVISMTNFSLTVGRSKQP
jgi:hypothetical protein